MRWGRGAVEASASAPFGLNITYTTDSSPVNDTREAKVTESIQNERHADRRRLYSYAANRTLPLKHTTDLLQALCTTHNVIAGRGGRCGLSTAATVRRGQHERNDTPMRPPAAPEVRISERDGRMAQGALLHG